MRVLIVIWSIRIGGAETLAIELCKYLKRRGYQPYLFPVLGPWDREYYELISTFDIPIISPFKNRILDWISWKLNALSLRFGMKSFRDLINRYAFKKFLKYYKIKLVVSHALVADTFAFENVKYDIPHIIVEHGDYSYCLVDNKPICLDALRHSNEVICVSKWCAQILNQTQLTIPITVIYNGHQKAVINEEETKYKFPLNEFLFCVIGRGIEYKGWEEAIKAFIIVTKEYPNTKLILIGDGIFLQNLKEKYGSMPQLLFTGRLTKPAELIKHVHVGLVPSQRYEAFGITILDFFSQGKPVIGTNVGGIPEVINYDNRTGGAIVPVDGIGKANINDLASQMIALMTNPDLYQLTSADASAIYQHFNFERTGIAYEEVIRKYVI